MSQFQFQYEPVAHLLSCGLHDMGYRHWLETSRDFPYNPDWAAYERLERDNAFRILAVRYQGHLIGYAGIRIYKNMQSRDVTCSYIQEYFIEKKFRPKGGGLEMFRIIEQHLKIMKVNFVTMHVPKNVPEIAKMFKHLGYEFQGELWGKAIKF